jgi:hypothetical protein
MNLMLFRHLWGVFGQWEDVFPVFKAAGYHGIESRMPEPKDSQRFLSLLETYGFEFIPQIFSQGETVEAHVESFREQLDRAKSFRPRLVNAHSGRDAFSEEERVRFFERALQLEAEAGIPVAHETHRGRILFTPWTTAHLLKRFPSLKLCCDFSHWVCVCERLLEDQAPVLRQCAARCIHLHARVGYEQGPQVPDPRAPEYARHLEAHERWWGLVWEAQAQRCDAVSTLTPEFGPPGYLHTLPFTNVPVSDLAEICNWQARRQADNFAARFLTASSSPARA